MLGFILSVVPAGKLYIVIRQCPVTQEPNVSYCWLWRLVSLPRVVVGHMHNATRASLFSFPTSLTSLGRQCPDEIIPQGGLHSLFPDRSARRSARAMLRAPTCHRRDPSRDGVGVGGVPAPL